MIRRIRDSHSFTLNAHLCIHVSHVSSSYSVLKVPVSSPAIYRAPKTAPNALYYKPVPAFDCWAPSRSLLSGPPANCPTNLFVFKVLPAQGTKKAGLLPAPHSQGACNLPTCSIRCCDPRRSYANACPRYRSRCGDEEARTPGLRRAKAALSQLSYIPGYNKLEL